MTSAVLVLLYPNLELRRTQETPISHLKMTRLIIRFQLFSALIVRWHERCDLQIGALKCALLSTLPAIKQDQDQAFLCPQKQIFGNRLIAVS